MHPKRMLLFGVAQKTGRGLPNCIIQDDKARQSEQVKVSVAVKAAKLTGDLGFPDLVVV